MTDHLHNRQHVLDEVYRELLGPAPCGEPIDTEGAIHFDDVEQSFRPRFDGASGEEILQFDSPLRRYGVGVLYPPGTIGGDDLQNLSDDAAADTDIDDTESGKTAVDVTSPAGGSDEYDFDLSEANTLRPSSMGLSFLATLPPQSTMRISISGGRYERKNIAVRDSVRTWWIRRPIALDVVVDSSEVQGGIRVVRRKLSLPDSPLGLELQILSRPWRRVGGDARLLTVSLVNRSEQSSGLSEVCLFQSAFAVELVGDGARALPYPEADQEHSDEDARSSALLYRQFRTFAVGHGCAGDWTATSHGDVLTLRADPMPCFETASTTPNIVDHAGEPVAVPIADLAGLTPDDDGVASLHRVVDEYEAWIAERVGELSMLGEADRATGEQHLQQCRDAVRRMRAGLQLIAADAEAGLAFRLANHAILLQQIRTRQPQREATFDSTNLRLEFSPPFLPTGELPLTDRSHVWRAFQIAFLLLSIGSVDDVVSAERLAVDLIWFPTGGGKTEAYLGLAAYQMFLRRLRDPGHDAVDVLMRYTLRLLTSQQFQRASALICAMDFLRRTTGHPLGDREFSIGLWVGGGTSPNRKGEATRALSALQKNERGATNPFVLLHCPWCGAQMGPLSAPPRSPAPRVIGYERSAGTVLFRCSDPLCDFASHIPVYVVDDDICERRPSLLIGTVDKFANLAWRPEARALFGISAAGERDRRAPGLIIQDELHLISGPLGSMVGLYESLIEVLCTDGRAEPPVPPKIVSSTATIRRYREQILHLYARRDARLFPPPGLTAEDSFFARYARDQSGNSLPGRTYVGVHAPGLGSLQTAQVRAFAATLQAPVEFDDAAARDPWWTLLVFFNSLRELGGALSLFQSDIPDYLRTVRRRRGIDWDRLRRLYNIEELTGRLQDEEIPQKLDALSASTTGSRAPVDAVLASNILEVGIDIDRLSLMAVVGQPKTTSQYIQVTGRVGRSWWERPGLVLSIYSASKPRDRSHFEKFRSYHQRLYAQVEPTSVTPFSPPALRRALHAVMVAYVRQCGDEAAAGSPYPRPDSLLEQFRRILRERVARIGEDETALQVVQQVFDSRLDEWRRFDRQSWQGSVQRGEIPFLRRPGEYVPNEVARVSWSTPTSLRNVDAECRGTISTLYALDSAGSS